MLRLLTRQWQYNKTSASLDRDEWPTLTQLRSFIGLTLYSVCLCLVGGALIDRRRLRVLRPSALCSPPFVSRTALSLSHTHTLSGSLLPPGRGGVGSAAAVISTRSIVFTASRPRLEHSDYCRAAAGRH